ncbi:MAG: DUF2341 domain-containing protein [Burkholderiales bacterium]|nr:DUF2341 domain-containing protein [Burkholderiales bacterium]
MSAPISGRSIVLVLLATFASSFLSSSAHAWWNKEWTQRTRIILNTSSGGVETRESLNDVVVPVRLHSGNFDFLTANPDGSDLRVIAADDKTPLAFTVERFDGTNELALLWVRVSSVLPGTDQNVLYIYAGREAARAEPSTDVFDANTRLALHFGESEGPAADRNGAIVSNGPVLREQNGLLAASLRLTGEPVTWPANERLNMAAGESLSLSLWVRPDSTAEGTLLRLGSLTLALEGGNAVAQAGTVRAVGGDVAAGVWTHIAVTLGAGKLIVYVNGIPVTETSLPSTPAFGGPLMVGERFEGQVDELRLLSALRGADWFRFEHAAQSADARLVASTSQSEEGADAEGEHAGYLGILVKNLTTDAWIVIVILAVMFVVSVWVMIDKALFIGRTDRANHRFLQTFRQNRENLLGLTKERAYAASSLHRLYEAGVRELELREVHAPGRVLSTSALNAVKAAIDADFVRESHVLNSKMVLLTIAISGGPFLGLLGTVVGVMITFAAIAAAGDVNVNAIAPGIAAALLATVAGLAVAIPALFGYNYLASRIKRISADLQIFVDEFVARVDERYGAP